MLLPVVHSAVTSPSVAFLLVVAIVLVSCCVSSLTVGWSWSIFMGRMNSWRYVLRSQSATLVSIPFPVQKSTPAVLPVIPVLFLFRFSCLLLLVVPDFRFSCIVRIDQTDGLVITIGLFLLYVITDGHNGTVRSCCPLPVWWLQ
jgi:hypothetical protein